MRRVRGRAPLTVILTIVFMLVVIIYYLLSSDDADNHQSSTKITGYPDDENEPTNFAERQRYDEARRIIKHPPSRTDEKYGSFVIDEVNHDEFNKRDSLFKGHKIVHLDLKGAPPVIDYYKPMLSLLKKLGATGILVEYEDMFPFGGDIKNISAANCYSEMDIAKIQRLARQQNLTVIPLVQTFGHLEFVLKLERYADLREVPKYPQVVCPTYNKTLSLVYLMIDQIVQTHPDIRHLHIGADEVYHLGECARCVETMFKNQWGKQQLFLRHTARVASYIKDKYPSITVLMWDDEFREISLREITQSGLNKLVEPVVWKYTSDPAATLTEQLWENYAAVWPSVWIATAFKGATEPDRYYTDISYHMENHRRWLEIINKYSGKINFKGAMLTGWQRYDHFGVLCELYATAVPSLAVNLAILQSSTVDGFPNRLPTDISKALECDGDISLSIPEPQYGWTKCNFEGVKIYSVTLRLYALEQVLSKMEADNTFKGWLKPYNIKHLFSSPNHVERAVAELDRYRMEIVYIEKEMRQASDGIYDNYTVDEWLETFLAPLDKKLATLWDAKEQLLSKREWPRRPLVGQSL